MPIVTGDDSAGESLVAAQIPEYARGILFLWRNLPMSTVRPLFGTLVVAAMLASTIARAASVPVTFSFAPASGTTNRVTVNLRETSSGLNLQDSEVTTFTGSLTGLIDYDTTGGTLDVNGFAITGGRFQATDMAFRLRALFVTVVSVDTTGVSGSVRTTPPLSVVTGGTFPTQDHLVRLDQGTLAVSGSAVTPLTVDLAVSPLELTTPGTGTFAVSQTGGGSGLLRDYLATVTLPVNATETVEGQPVVITATGNLVLTAPLTIDFAPPGDFNRDGTVDAGDYTMWRDQLGATTTASDFAVWRANFGTTAPGSLVQNTAVPEPTSVAGAMIVLVVGIAAAYMRQ